MRQFALFKPLRLQSFHLIEVSEEHAYKEGEGDRSLAYWRAVHEEFFTKEFEETKN